MMEKDIHSSSNKSQVVSNQNLQNYQQEPKQVVFEDDQNIVQQYNHQIHYQTKLTEQMINSDQNLKIQKNQSNNQNQNRAPAAQLTANSNNIFYNQNQVNSGLSQQIRTTSITNTVNNVQTVNLQRNNVQRINLKERQKTPGRYFPTSDSQSQQKVREPSPTRAQPMIMTFGGHSINRINRIQTPIVFSSQGSFKSRIISQREGRPLKHLPDYLRDKQLKQQVTIKPYSASITKTQPYPIASTIIVEQPQYRVKNQVTGFRTNSLYQTNKTVARPVIYSSVINQQPQIIRQNRVPSPNSVSIMTKKYSPPKITINSNIVVGANSVTTQRVDAMPIIPGIPMVPVTNLQFTSKTLQSSIYSNQVTVVYKQFYWVVQQIKLIMTQQVDNRKREVIRSLLLKITELQEKLSKIQKNWDAIIQQNNSLKQRIRGVKTQTIIKKQEKQQINYQPQLIQFQNRIDILLKQNTTIKQKLSTLQQQNVSLQIQNNQEQLLNTIENQKGMIKKLQQQLLQATQNQVGMLNVENLNKTPTQYLNVNQNSADIPNPDANQSSKVAKKRTLQVIDQSLISQNQNKYMAIIQSKQAYINQLEAEIIRYKTQIKNLKKQLVKQRSQKTVSSTIGGDESSLNSTQRFKNFQGSTQKLGNIIIQKQRQNEDLKRKIYSIQDQYDIMMEEKETRIRELLQQMSNIQKNSLYQDQQPNKHQELNDQIKRLSSIVKQKQIQIQQLNQQNTKKTGRQEQIKTLNYSLQLRDQQQQKLQQIINTLQFKVKQLENNAEKANQMKNLVQTIKNKQVEITKLNKVIENYLKDIKRLEQQTNSLNQRFKYIEEGVIEQRRSSSQKQHQLEERIRELSNKSEFHDQSQINRYKQTISQLHNRLRYMQNSQIEQSRKANDVAVGENQQDFRLQYSQSQVKIFQLEAALRSSQNRIKHLQSNLQSMKVRKEPNHNIDQQSYIHEINILRKKLGQYQSKAAHINMASYINSYNPKQHELNHVFQQKIIYQLKNQNQKLKSLLVKQGRFDFSPHSYPLQDKKIQKSQKIYISTIQKRLYQFNKKLEQIISFNKQVQHQNYSNIKGKHGINAEVMSSFQKQKSFIVKRYNKEIQILQKKMFDLQRYCSSLQNFQDSVTFNTITATEIKTQENKMVYDQISFYKNKNKQLQQRIDVLLVLNKQLKSRLQTSVKPQGTDRSLQYYREQIRLFQKSAQEYQVKIKKLLQDKNNMVKSLQALKGQKVNQQELRSLQLRVKQLNTLNIKAQQTNKILQQQLRRHRQQASKSQSQNLNFKTEKNQNQNIIRVYVSKIADYENQNSILKNQNQILKAEIQRVQEQISLRKNDSQSEIQSYRKQLYQLNNELRNFQTQRQTEKYGYQQTINTLKNKISMLQSSNIIESQKLKNSGMKFKQFESKLNQLEYALSTANQQNARLKQLLQQYEYQIQSMNILKNQMQKQSPTNSRFVESSIKSGNNFQTQFCLEKIRSILLEIESISEEIDDRQNIMDRIKSQISVGLKTCEDISANL